MAEKDTAEFGVYDWLDVMEYNRAKRRCPKCGGIDVKFALHSRQGIDSSHMSVLCNECKHSDSGLNSGPDAERIVREWHELPAPRTGVAHE
jgi:hypothetical protein